MGFRSLFSNKKKKQNPTTTTLDSTNPTTSNGAVVVSRSPSINIQAQIEDLEQVFKKFDVNGDGKISASELGSILGSLGSTASEEDIDKMIKAVDADGDGHIDLKEFIELNTTNLDSEDMIDDLKNAFGVYDLDGNGSISADELQQVLKSLGDDCSIGECRKMIDGVDSDGDGMICFDEFKVMMMLGSRFAASMSSSS